MAVVDGKPIIGIQVSIPIFDLVRLLSVAQCSMYSTCFLAQTRRDDIECHAYTLIDCLRDLPWRRITGGTNKQFEDRVREKKGSWTSERLCVGLTGSSQTFLALVRGVKNPITSVHRRRLRVILSKGDI